MDAILNMNPTAQHWVNVFLLWLGFGTFVAILVRSLLPGREPVGMISTITIGVAGTWAGPLIVSTIWNIKDFNPISPIGFFASFVCAFLCLLIFQAGIAVAKRRQREID